MPQRGASLETYDKKRDFKQTAEPPGLVEPSGDVLRYVVQKHDATRLHYDVRLEMNGAYKSWAVPKGPSLDPSVRRMAVETEDHPMAYGTFEGTIPKGQYGGGTVLLWDVGTFIPDGDPLAAYEKGHIKFTLEGQKLRGAFHLVRMKNQGARQTAWLLFKSKDQHAQAGMNVDALDEASVKTGRSLAEIETIGQEQGSMPSIIEPQLCALVDAPPRGEEWIHEPKIDGYRLMIRKEGGEVQLITRGGLDWAERFPRIVDAVRSLPVANVILDGEVTMHDKAGTVAFDALQQVLANKQSSEGMVCYLFDCLFLEGHDIRSRPLLERKEVLVELLAALPAPAQATLVAIAHEDADPAKLLEEQDGRGCEGIVSKRKTSSYTSGRSDSWQKVKTSNRQELVVIGFTDSAAGPKRIGSLLVAARKADDELVFVGKVGTGYTAQDKRDLFDRLAPLQRPASFIQPRPQVVGARQVHWVEPTVVVEVSYRAVTRDGILRHASYHGIRQDKVAPDVPAELPRGPPSKRPSTTPARVRSLPAGAIEVLGVRVTSASRVIYEGESEITKGVLAEYIAAVAPLMLPFIARRPLSILRCPSGSTGQCFFQKHLGQGMPESVKSIHVPNGIAADNDDKNALCVDDPAGLVGLVQMGVLEIHPWGAAPDDPERPDRIIFDLDPDEGLAWSRVCDGARAVRALMKRDGLVSFVKSTGGKGLHVEVPLTGDARWEDVKAYALSIAQQMEQQDASRYTANLRKDARKGRIFVDYLRNGRGATAIGPYSMRAKGPTVAVPLGWEELDEFVPGSVTVLTLHERFAMQKTKPWARYLTTRQRLPVMTQH